jgi:hypothetical protein
MEWLLFTYWLPPEPSRKRVSIWRQLKKIGALSSEGASWLLPKTEPLLAAITEIKHAVEEMEGTTSLYIVNHFDETQEQRAIARFQQERDNEYAQISTECHKALKHIDREYQTQEFNFEEMEELEGDLEKINRWFSEAKKRDFWETLSRSGVEKMIGEVESKLTAFTQKTYDESAKLTEENESPK